MKTVKLIVYGTLMTGELNHRFCDGAVSIEPCKITGTLYDTGHGYPAFKPEGDYEVAAELVEIPIEDWKNVDNLEGYPRLYDRKVILAKCNAGREVEGWVYIMNRLPERAKVIESGSWKERKKPRKA